MNENIVRLMSGFIIVGLLIYLILSICSFIIKNNVTLTLDSIRIEQQSEYPNTDNPIMFGVTTKEYTAIEYGKN